MYPAFFIPSHRYSEPLPSSVVDDLLRRVRPVEVSLLTGSRKEEDMTEKDKRWAEWCACNDTARFYNSRRWRNVRNKILQQDHHECQNCKSKYHRYRKADTVHHVNHFKDRPDLALEPTYRDPALHIERRNLISLCHECHEEVHGYRIKEKPGAIITEERWD